MSNFKQSCLILNKPSGLTSNEALKNEEKETGKVWQESGFA